MRVQDCSAIDSHDTGLESAENATIVQLSIHYNAASTEKKWQTPVVSIFHIHYIFLALVQKENC